jgi:DNA-binding PadR family transcriptional regulator
MEVLLGLLTIESMSGYDLGQTIQESIGHFWNESYGQIYPNLKTLAAEGSVISKIEKQRGKPDRHIYSITKKGRERLAKWLAVPPQPEVPRNEMLLKLFFGSQVSPEIPIGYLNRMMESERAALERFRQIRAAISGNKQHPDTPYWKMAVRFGETEVEAHLRWANETLAELKKIAGKHRSRAVTRKENSRAGK